MKFRKITAFFLILTICFLTNRGISGENDNKWNKASKNMVTGLKDGNDGLKQSIMQNIIRFSDSLDVDEAVFDIMSIYRDHEDEGMRQLALIALYKMKNSWALSFLERAIKFEKSDRLRKSICAILYDCNRPVGPESLAGPDYATVQQHSLH
jgi:hypothetical protein